MELRCTGEGLRFLGVRFTAGDGLRCFFAERFCLSGVAERIAGEGLRFFFEDFEERFFSGVADRLAGEALRFFSREPLRFFSRFLSFSAAFLARLAGLPSEAFFG